MDLQQKTKQIVKRILIKLEPVYKVEIFRSSK